MSAAPLPSGDQFDTDGTDGGDSGDGPTALQVLTELFTDIFDNSEYDSIESRVAACAAAAADYIKFEADDGTYAAELRELLKTAGENALTEPKPRLSVIDGGKR